MRWEKHKAFEGVKNLRPSGSGTAGRRKRKDKGAALWARRYRTPLITGSLRPLLLQMPAKKKLGRLSKNNSSYQEKHLQESESEQLSPR